MRSLSEQQSLADSFAPDPDEKSHLQLKDGSRAAVIGGGPGGSFFSYFLLSMAETVGIGIDIDIYEPRQFSHCGPAGCNHCGGIVSESLVQVLATEGINLPTSVVQRGIDSYVLHMDVGTVRIDTPLQEKRIAAVFRGNGPRDAEIQAGSFDRYLQGLAQKKGARVVRKLVSDLEWVDARPRLIHPDGPGAIYDLVAVGVGINSSLLRCLQTSSIGYRPPKTAMTYICEFLLDRETIHRYLGTSMHVFLLDLPRLEFAALIPKGDVVTMCLLGDDIDTELVECFLNSAEVRECFPPDLEPLPKVCNCSPLINIAAAEQPFADRIVFLGDSGVTRLYKDGIGAAYRTAKAAAITAVFQGIAADDFRRHFWPVCRNISADNSIGKFVFAFNQLFQKKRFSRRAILRMTAKEQVSDTATRHMSRVLWDLFTGSAPYREVLRNTMRPGFMVYLAWNLMLGMVPRLWRVPDGAR
jgi:flavin-dependent dehydrogenase